MPEREKGAKPKSDCDRGTYYEGGSRSCSHSSWFKGELSKSTSPSMVIPAPLPYFRCPIELFQEDQPTHLVRERHITKPDRAARGGLHLFTDAVRAADDEGEGEAHVLRFAQENTELFRGHPLPCFIKEEDVAAFSLQ